MGETEDYDKSATPTAHASSHENAGSDEISVASLSGQLADSQPSTWSLVSGKPTTFTPAAHKTSHQDGGADEISVQGLSGALADNQPSTWTLVSGKPTTFAPEAHKTSHQDGGSDEISVQGLSGTLADAQTPAAHKTSHQDGGADEISVAGLSGLLADDQHVLDTEVETVITTRQKAKGYRATAQNITADQWNLIDIDTDDYDPDNIVDLTNRRIKPTRAGYYIISAHVVLSDLAYWIAAIHKNGTRMADTAQQYGYGGANTVFAYANGTTDYFDWRVWGNAASSLFVTPASAANYIAVMGPF